MADFSHLRALEVATDGTTEFALHQITVNGKSPVLHVAPATEANKPYFNALLKRSGRNVRQVRSGNINASMIEENREEDRELYPRHIVKGWSDVLDANGEELEFSAGNCTDFLAALPGWLFDELRNFCGNPASFAELLDVEVSAKN